MYLFKRLRIRSLKHKLIFIFFAITAIVLIVQVTVFQGWIGTIIRDQTKTYFEETIRQIGKRVEMQYEQFHENMESARQNQVIKNYLRDLKNNAIHYHIAKYKISNQVLRASKLDVIDNIFVFPVDHEPMNLFYSIPIFEADDETKKLMESFDVRHANEVIWQVQLEPFQVSVMMYIYEGKDLLGLLRIDLSESFYKQINEVALGESGQVYLIRDGMITYAHDMSWINKQESELAAVSGTKVEYPFEYRNWKMIGIVPDKELIHQVSQVNRIFLFMEILIMIAILAFLLSTVRLILKPLKKLLKGMEHIQQGKLDVIIGHKGDDEFSVIIRQFNDMVERVDHLIKTIYHQQIHYRKTEMMNLQSKLDPHFLYNTLDMIYWSAIVKDEEEIGEAILALSSILRYSISYKNEFVTIAEDLGQLNNYLKIQKMRFENKLEYSMDIAEDILEVKIPRLLIQPLLENAIKYAFENMKIGGNITVKAYAVRQDLYFEVIDNGIGMSEEKMNRLLNNAGNKGNGGIGIRLIQHRIAYIFGEGYGLSIDSKQGKGTKVTIHLNKNTNFLHEEDAVL